MTINKQPYDSHGLQDTVLIPGHVKVVILIPFEDFIDRFVYNCHIMFHEDGGILGVFEVFK